MSLSRKVSAVAMASMALVLVAGGAASARPRADEPATPTPPGVADQASMVKLNNCSGGLVRFRNAQDTDKAMLLTNGHCMESGEPPMGTAVINKASSRTGTLLAPNGSSLGTVRATRILYGTMTNTDMALYELTDTIGDIKTKYKTESLILAEAGPKPGDKITATSSYFKTNYRCQMTKQVYRVREGEWTWKDSISFTVTPQCKPGHGTSGSPILSDVTGEVVGVNNTGNDDGEKCTDNNPCEVDENGTISIDMKANYGQQTFWAVTCENADRKLDLKQAGCLLDPK